MICSNVHRKRTRAQRYRFSLPSPPPCSLHIPNVVTIFECGLVRGNRKLCRSSANLGKVVFVSAVLLYELVMLFVPLDYFFLSFLKNKVQKLLFRILLFWWSCRSLLQIQSPAQETPQLQQEDQCIVATVEDSVLRTEMPGLESQKEDDPKSILFFNPMSWLGQIRPHRRVWSASL